MSTVLNQTNLRFLPHNVLAPSYDRSGLEAGILHVGLGNFQRAHMAVYLDNLFAMGEGHDWAVIGASVRPSNTEKRERLKDQDWLTTLVELDPQVVSARVIGSLIDFAPADPTAIIGALINPRIRIVSLSITEGGYYIDSANGKFAQDHPDIVADAANSEAPRTIFGMIIKALVHRRAMGLAPFTVLSCDNLPGNGNLTKQTVTGLAALFNAELAHWIDTEVSFPNSMVDCITPVTTERERKMVQEQFGVLDYAPVVCEPFRQWVIEDHFSAGRPPLEKVGVEFVSDVSHYELMKLRILNAGHASIAYAASLLGYHFVHEAMADVDIVNWLRALQTRDAIPTLPPIQGVDYSAYLETVITRFSNPNIGDTIPRLTADGSDRQPKFILPTLYDALAADGSIDGLALELALWCRYCGGETDESITIKDSQDLELRRRAQEAVQRPVAFLENTTVFGDLGENPRFVNAFCHWLDRLRQTGVRKALQEYCANVQSCPV